MKVTEALISGVRDADIDVLLESGRALGTFDESRAREFLDVTVERGRAMDALAQLARVARDERDIAYVSATHELAKAITIPNDDTPGRCDCGCGGVFDEDNHAMVWTGKETMLRFTSQKCIAPFFGQRLRAIMAALDAI